jgi:hypothetical protein
MRVLVACTLLLSLAVVSSVRAQEPVPPDFRLVAQYGPGLSAGKPWTVSVDAEGAAVLDVYGDTGAAQKSTQSFALSPDAVARLAKAAADSGFFRLAGTYAYTVPDHPTLSLRVTMNEATHEVVVHAPQRLQGSDEVRRFLVVWNEVLRAVPNPEQRAR